MVDDFVESRIVAIEALNVRLVGAYRVRSPAVMVQSDRAATAISTGVVRFQHAVVFEAALFILAVGLKTKHQLVVVDLVPVELGAVHAGELGFASHRDAAPAAHAGAVHHDRIQADDGLDPVLGVTLETNFIIGTGPMATANCVSSLSSTSFRASVTNPLRP